MSQPVNFAVRMNRKGIEARRGRSAIKMCTPFYGYSNSCIVCNQGKRGRTQDEEGNVYFGDYLPHCDLSSGCVSLDAEKGMRQTERSNSSVILRKEEMDRSELISDRQSDLAIQNSMVACQIHSVTNNQSIDLNLCNR